MKRCSKCEVEQNDSEFYKDRIKTDGLQSQCKTCKRTHGAYQQAYQREYRIEYRKSSVGKEAFRKGSKKYRENNPQKCKARNAISTEVFSGRMKASVFCEECGLPKKTEAHHPDYDKLLEVDWLCKGCHSIVHLPF